MRLSRDDKTNILVLVALATILTILFAWDAHADSEAKDSQYLEFKRVTSEARANGDCVKSEKTKKVYVPTVDGKWGRCVKAGTWEIIDDAQIEFYANETKAGGWEVVACTCE